MNIVALLLAVIASITMACSSAVRVPSSDYGNPGSAAAYHIRTADDQNFSVSRYKLADSLIIVEEWSQSSKAEAKSPPATPFEIPLRDVVSIERIVMDRGKSSAWLFGLGAAFVAFLFIGLSIAYN